MSLLVVAAVLASGPACECLENLSGPEPAGAVAPGYGVILRIVNQSGVPVQVEVGYLFGQTRTRDTMRLLAAEGIETEQIVLWTRAGAITATARVSAGPPSGAARLQIGDVIAEQEYRYDVDYHAGDTIEFVIPELGPGPDPLADCNGNGVFDTLDLAAGTSLDCNGNEIPDECDTADGTSADHDGDAVPDECEQEACCFADGSCQEKIAQECVDSGGHPQGAGTACATAHCPAELTEACCFSGGSCQNLSAAACAAQGGMAKGAGTSCQTTTCPADEPQACCFSGGSCQNLSVAECAAQGGTPQGAETACATANCPQPTQACCFAGGSCSDLTLEKCLYWEGDSQGTGTNCQTTTCPADETVACCFAGGSCSDLTLDECLYWEGDSQGIGTNCQTTTCPAGPP